jgi:hypothetical protein
LDTDSARLLRRSGMLWKKAPQPIRRELLVALFQDIVIY